MSTEENLNAGRPVQVGAHSPESLRVALEKTCDRFEAMAARNGDVRLGADAVLKAIHELLAAHPVEPAGVRLAREGLEEMHARMAAESVGVSDEAVDALARVLFDAEWVPGDWSWEQYPTPNRWHDLARKGLAALPHLQPQPVASREALRERIAEALHDIDNVHTWQQEDRC
ncbi:hypothetical protein, partial [Streptomyces sp.]|uniref:hypothetical protein n=1 Tax=Streptomyces sp. TaxID=1931 RepID=UPI002F938B65